MPATFRACWTVFAAILTSSTIPGDLISVNFLTTAPATARPLRNHRQEMALDPQLPPARLSENRLHLLSPHPNLMWNWSHFAVQRRRSSRTWRRVSPCRRQLRNVAFR